MAGGRPSSYDPEYHPQHAYKFALLGVNDEKLAELFDVSVATISNWKNAHPEFLEALLDGKGRADANVAKSLYHRALGYSHPETKVFQSHKHPDGYVTVVVEKHHPPDTGAATLWLKNRGRNHGANWTDKTQVEVTADDSLADMLALMRKRVEAADSGEND